MAARRHHRFSHRSVWRLQKKKWRDVRERERERERGRGGGGMCDVLHPIFKREQHQYYSIVFLSRCLPWSVNIHDPEVEEFAAEQDPTVSGRQHITDCTQRLSESWLLIQPWRSRGDFWRLPWRRWSQLPTEMSEDLLMVSKFWHLSIYCGAVKVFLKTSCIQRVRSQMKVVLQTSIVDQLNLTG